jgi:hypothetical protein
MLIINVIDNTQVDREKQILLHGYPRASGMMSGGHGRWLFCPSTTAILQVYFGGSGSTDAFTEYSGL